MVKGLTDTFNVEVTQRFNIDEKGVATELASEAFPGKDANPNLAKTFNNDQTPKVDNELENEVSVPKGPDMGM